MTIEAIQSKQSATDVTFCGNERSMSGLKAAMGHNLAQVVTLVVEILLLLSDFKAFDQAFDQVHELSLCASPAT